MNLNTAIDVTLPALVEQGPSGMVYLTVPSLDLVLAAETADELKDMLADELEAQFPGAAHDADAAVDEGLGRGVETV